MSDGYVAVIADVVGSRELDPGDRTLLQEEIGEFLATVNEGYADAIAAGFVITTGDEFQGLLKDGSVVPDLLWAARTHLSRARIRMGVGFGELHTPLRPDAVGMDGPVFHAARAAIVVAKDQGWNWGVFSGFGPQANTILDGLARLLERQVETMTAKQREVANLLRDGLDQSEVADRLHVTRQAVSSHARSLGWGEWKAGEHALRAALAYFSK